MGICGARRLRPRTGGRGGDALGVVRAVVGLCGRQLARRVPLPAFRFASMGLRPIPREPAIDPQPGRVKTIREGAHAAPPDALACAGACAPLGLPLFALEALEPGELDPLGLCELAGFASWETVRFDSFRALGSCFRWAFDGRCGLTGDRLRLSRTPEVGVQGDADESVKADADSVGPGSGSGVEGVGKS
jgi:hypothetical protein